MYRAGVIGLGWMGLLYDLASRVPDRYEIDDAHRPTPDLDIHRPFYHFNHAGNEGGPASFAEALWDRPEVDLVAGADRDPRRLRAFGERYGVDALYGDAGEMLCRERLDILGIATNVKGRADLTCLAIECGARGIVTAKPMARTLEEADRMVAVCAAADAPLCCGATTTTHPSFARAKTLLTGGAIGNLVSVEAIRPCAQHQNWSYFLESPPAWVAGTGDGPPHEEGSTEFTGQGMMVTDGGPSVFFRSGAPDLRLTGDGGEMTFVYTSAPRGLRIGWRLWQDVETRAGRRRLEMPWPDPQFVPPYGAVYAFADVLECLAGKLDEPKNSGRRVAVALEVEVALKLSSAQGGARVDLPLRDRSLGLSYDWFR
jgi:hypothetical protein